jgi:hypothetical protein
VRYGTRAEVCPDRTRLKTGWVEDGGRNQAPVRSYGRAFAAKALISIAAFDDDTAEHRAKRRRLVEKLQDDEVPRRPDFDRAAAQRGVEGVMLEARRRYGASCRALLSRAGGPPPAVLPRVLTEDVMRMQTRVRLLVRKHGLPSLGAATLSRELRRMAAESPDDFAALMSLRAELGAALRRSLEALGGDARSATAAAAAAGAVSGGTDRGAACGDVAARCAACAQRRHLDLEKLRADPRYRLDHEQLALLPPERLLALLEDPAVSYECPLVALRAKRAL